MKTEFAPSQILFGALIAAAAVCLLAYALAINQPWLGIEFHATDAGGGLMVMDVDERSPNSSLKAGQSVVAISGDGHDEPVSGVTFSDYLTWITDYNAYNRLSEHHRVLSQLIASDHFDFVLSDGQRVPGKITSVRPVLDLPWGFWAVTMSGGVTFLIGTSIYAFRPKLLVSRILLVASIGYLVQAVLIAVLAFRELTLPPFWLGVAYQGSILGLLISLYAMVALVWYYPTAIAKFPVGFSCTLLGSLMWLNDVFQLVNPPFELYVAEYLSIFIAVLAISIIKWKHYRNDALSRAEFQWVIMGITVVVALATFLYFVPMIYSARPVISLVTVEMLGPLLLVGFAFGIVRYRLFDLDRWWAEVWLWIAGGILVVVIDVVLIGIAGLGDWQSLVMAIMIAGWVYFPLRQWVFRRMLSSPRSRLSDHLPAIVGILFRDAGGTFAERWSEILRHIFEPTSMSLISHGVSSPGVVESGLYMRVPALEGDQYFELRYRDHGRKLYTPRDVDLANVMLELTRNITELWRAREEGAKVERSRIMRDLHDDVAGRLLSLVHRSQDSHIKDIGREALQALRQTIYAMDDQRPIKLTDLLIELEAQVRERLRDSGIMIDWQEKDNIPAIPLSPRLHLNLLRVIQETTSNILRHGHSTRVLVSCSYNNALLRINVCNDGGILQVGDWKPGKGLNNIRNRMAEVGARANWTERPATDTEPQMCCLELQVVLPEM